MPTFVGRSPYTGMYCDRQQKNQQACCYVGLMDLCGKWQLIGEIAGNKYSESRNISKK